MQRNLVVKINLATRDTDADFSRDDHQVKGYDSYFSWMSVRLLLYNLKMLLQCPGSKVNLHHFPVKYRSKV
jgi:hypothetical protein